MCVEPIAYAVSSGPSTSSFPTVDGAVGMAKFVYIGYLGMNSSVRLRSSTSRSINFPPMVVASSKEGGSVGGIN